MRQECGLKLGTFNPGRTGLTALGTDALLFWRLWAIDIALSEAQVHFCVIPGARYQVRPGLNYQRAFILVGMACARRLGMQ